MIDRVLAGVAAMIRRKFCRCLGRREYASQTVTNMTTGAVCMTTYYRCDECGRASTEVK